MGRLVRQAKVGQVNWQQSGGGPEFATVKRACQTLHLKQVAASRCVPFEASEFAAWVKKNTAHKKNQVRKRSRSSSAVACASTKIIMILRFIAKSAGQTSGCSSGITIGRTSKQMSDNEFVAFKSMLEAALSPLARRGIMSIEQMFALQGYGRSAFVKLSKIKTADGRQVASCASHRTTRQSKYYAIW